MGVRHYRELIAWQLGEAFRCEIRELLLSSPRARRDLEFSSQLRAAARSVPSNIVEGFVRMRKKEFVRFIDISLASLMEAERHLREGIDEGYFAAPRCEVAFRFGRRCFKALVNLKRSQMT